MNIKDLDYFTLSYVYYRYYHMWNGVNKQMANEVFEKCIENNYSNKQIEELFPFGSEERSLGLELCNAYEALNKANENVKEMYHNTESTKVQIKILDNHKAIILKIDGETFPMERYCTYKLNNFFTIEIPKDTEIEIPLECVLKIGTKDEILKS